MLIVWLDLAKQTVLFFLAEKEKLERLREKESGDTYDKMVKVSTMHSAPNITDAGKRTFRRQDYGTRK